MVYIITEDTNFSFLKRRIISTYQPRSYIDCIGRYHQVHDFNLRETGSIELLYKDQLSSDNFKITLKLANLDFHFEMEKNNRCYREYLSDQWQSVEKTNHIIRRNLTLVGLTIGDLLKHFYYTQGVDLFKPNKEKRRESIESDDHHEENNKWNEMIVTLLKKVIKIETNSIDIRDVLGLYVYRGQTVYLWDYLKINGYLSKGTDDFAGFCRKIIYFSHNSISQLIGKNKEGQFVVIDDQCTKLFNDLTNKRIVSKLFKYYLHNEDPEIVDTAEVYYFDTPKPVPEILKYLHEKTNDNTYIDLYYKIMKKLNNHQQNELESKYQPIIFQSMNNIPGEYPLFAFRNISLKQWTTRGYANDIYNLRDHYFNYMSLVRNSKLKHRSNISNKTIPVNHRFYSGSCEWHCDKGTKKARRMAFHQDVASAMQILEDDSVYFQEN
jgi:hypothetical protein